MARRISGFTLIELIVVIAITVLLVALLMPVLSAARQASRATYCMSNLRQMTTAWFNYATEHDGYGPLTVNDVDHPVPYYWTTALSPYVGGPSTRDSDAIPMNLVFYRCPEWQDQDISVRTPGYGMSLFPRKPMGTYLPPPDGSNRYTLSNSRWSMAPALGTWQRTDDWFEPAKNINLGDSSIFHFYINASRPGYVKTDPAPTGVSILTNRHGDEHANFAFADGHAATLHRIEAYAGATDPTGRYVSEIVPATE